MEKEEKMNKKAAMEMSVGTIVTIVLLMGVLVMGIFLIQRIFASAKGAIDLTDQQLRDQINKLFSEEKMISIYPGTRFVEIKQESSDGVGIGIRNTLVGGVGGTATFNYDVYASDMGNCGVSEQVAENWIIIGESEEDIPINSGDYTIRKVLFEIPTGAPLCTMRFTIRVDWKRGGGTGSDTDFFDIKIKPK